MYIPPLFREERLTVQHALIREHPLGILVTIGSEGLSANPIPFILQPDRGPLGTLQGHLARANPQWRDHNGAQDALVVFQGPERYITPSWYATKQQTGKVVPTWNYAMVQVQGRIRVIEDQAWLADQVAALTDRHEADRPESWAVTDAPPAFIAGQLKGIVGIEIEIARIEGKWKVSQNRPEADRSGVVASLVESGEPAARAMAMLVNAQGATSASSS